MHLRLKHSGSMGDLLAALPLIRSMQKQLGVTQTTMYLCCEFSQAEMVQRYGKGFSQGAYWRSCEWVECIKPLLESQGLCVEEWRRGQEVDYDLDIHLVSRDLPSVAREFVSIAEYYFRAFPQFNGEAKSPWLHLEAEPHERVVVSRSPRYRNLFIKDYSILDEHRPLFLGKETEFREFRVRVPHAQWQPTRDYLAAAKIIAGARLFVSNQTGLWWVAEGLAVPRVLETYLAWPNCVPLTPNGKRCAGQREFNSVIQNALEVAFA